MKPFYEDESVTVYAGDCLDVLPTLPDASVDSICTDPPYSLGFMAREWDTHEEREDAAFAYWLTGFIDGEGCFRVQRHERGTYTCTFSIKVRRDERGTLERIQRFLGGSGTIRDGEGSGNAHPQSTYAVQDKAGCLRLVRLLDKYPLRAKKRLDYEAWAEAVIEWNQMRRGHRWSGRADWSRMAELKRRVEAAREYADPPWSGHGYQDWCRLWAAECLRVLKPGGHLLAFGGARTYHRLTCAIEDAGFEIRDQITWLYGSGFPKSLDVSKAIDKAAGAEREVLVERTLNNNRFATSGDGQPQEQYRKFEGNASITAPATDDARRWSGWGTALKPAHEPIVVARKPLVGTVAQNVLTHGTGALNIDGCRVPHRSEADKAESEGKNRHADFGSGPRENKVYGVDNRPRGADGNYDGSAGRWPTNVVLSHAPLLDESGEVVGDACADGCVEGCPVAELDQQSGMVAGATSNGKRRTGYAGYDGGWRETPQVPGYADTGGASRFFPVFRYEAKADSAERPRVGGVAHPTVKPLDLMRWLVRLVTPPGGLVLDPFAGSGTTGEACVVEGFRAVLIEREPDYLPLIVARLTKPLQPALDVTP